MNVYTMHLYTEANGYMPTHTSVAFKSFSRAVKILSVKRERKGFSLVFVIRQEFSKPNVDQIHLRKL